MSDLPYPHATLGRGSVATISREELKLKLDTNEPIKLVMASTSAAVGRISR